MRPFLLFLLLIGLECTAFGDPAEDSKSYVNRAHWFELKVPQGWNLQEAPRGAETILSLQSVSAQAEIVLEVRTLQDLPELASRQELVDAAGKILQNQRGIPLEVSVREISGLPLTGVVVEYKEGHHFTRLTIVVDPPRHRAFLWRAKAPAEIFPSYDVVFDQVVASLVPDLPT